MSTAGAFGHVLPGHLDMDAAGVCAFRTVHVEERGYLIEDPIEGACLVARIRAQRIAVHGVAGPHHVAPFTFHHTDQRW